MPEWTPPPNLERYAQQYLSRNMTERVRVRDRKRSELVESAAARGLSGSGYVEVEKARLERDGFRDAILKSLDELLALVELVYGAQIPIEGYSWIETKLNEYLEGWLQQDVSTAEPRAVERDREERRMLVFDLRRDIELKLGPRSLAGTIKQAVVRVKDGQESPKEYDAFISYASEDRDDLVWPLYEALKKRGISCWIDKSELKVGDSLLEKLSQGLNSCHFGVVVFSHSFFGKQWPQHELAAMFAMSVIDGKRLILPVWHQLEGADLKKYAPFFLDTLAANSSSGVEVVADQLKDAIAARLQDHQQSSDSH